MTTTETAEARARIIERAAEHVLATSRRGTASLSQEQFDADTDKLMSAYRDIIGKALPILEASLTSPAQGGEWRDILSAPMWQVAVVTDGENVAISQKAETDFDGFYWAVEPEDALEWQPTHWIPWPPAPTAMLSAIPDASPGSADEAEIVKPRCGCPSDTVRRVLIDHGTCRMGGCPYGGDI